MNNENISSLLINEPPLQALPSLAEILGLNGAVILQQIHYWLQGSSNERDGFIWIYNSYEDWAKQFPWLTPNGIKKHILILEKAGYLISAEFNRANGDRRKWYRIDYGKLTHSAKSNNPHSAKSNDHSAKSNDGSECDSSLKNEHHENTTIDYQQYIEEEVVIEPHFKELLVTLDALPYWIPKYIKDDVAWLTEFCTEYPEISIQLIRECRDFWDGRRASNKGIWKNRLRNWCKTARKIKGKDGAHKTDARRIPATYTRPEDL